ncbi:MAG TPA: tetratricopeptide repeat protein [Candidatus Wallbacteria bacterium]|nr:tetratricopeptide repeat protein [Candidatus Wallbacteria bacterium]
MDFSTCENYLNRFCAAFIFYAALILSAMTLMPDSIVPIQLPAIVVSFMRTLGIPLNPANTESAFYASLFIAALLITAAFLILPKRIISEMNFWLMIAIFLMLPFLYSRDTKENFLLVKETALRMFLISMFAIYLFRRLSHGAFYDDLAKVPWHLWAFVGMGITSFLWTKTPYSTFHYSLIFISYLVFFIVMSDTIKKPWQFYSLSDILITAASIASVYGILQYYQVAGTGHNYDPLFGTGEVIGNTDRKRVFSFFGNPVFLGVYLDAALPIAFAMFVSSFATGVRWAHKYEKFLLRSQVLLSLFAIVYSFTFMALANSSVSSLMDSLKSKGTPLSDGQVSDLIVAAGSTSFIVAPVLFACLVFGLIFLYHQLPYWQEHEKQIYRLANGLFCFLSIFTCIFITFTRTAWIATAVSLFAFVVYLILYAHDLLYAYRKWIIGFVTLFAVATIFLTATYFRAGSLNRGTESIENRFKSAFTVVQRIMLYDITLNVIKLNPILGHGLGSFGYMYPIHQAKFYAGEFRYFIDWINSFGKMSLPNRMINFVVWSFDKITKAGLYQTMMTLYFIVFLIGGTLLLIYYKVLAKLRGFLNARGTLLREAAIAYFIALALPLLLVFSKFLGANKYYLGLNDNILSINPDDYQWLSAGFAHVHNEYLQVWSDMGIFALLIFLYVFCDYFYKGSWLLKKLKNSPDRIIIIGYLCAIIASLVESIANFPYQRIMPVVIATVGFTLIFNGRRIFAEYIAYNEENSIELEDEFQENAVMIDQKASRSYKYCENDGPLFDDSMPSGLDKSQRQQIIGNIPFYAVVSVMILSLNYFPIRYVLGNIDLKSGHTFISQAQMVRSDPNNGNEKFNLIIKEGLRYLERSTQRVPYNPEAWFWFGDTLKLIGRYDEAIEKFNKALTFTNTKHVFYSKGISYFEKYKQSGDNKFMDTALENWKNAIAVNPNFPQPLFHLGYYEFQKGNFKDSYEYFKKAIKWDSDKTFTDAYRFGGIAAYYLKEMTEAVKLLTQVRETSSGRGVDKYLGGIYYQQSKYEEALPCLEDAFEESPNDSEVYASLINTYKRLNQSEKAIAAFQKKNAAIKDTPQYTFELGRLYAILGNTDKALLELGKGVEKSPNDIRFLEEIGRIYFEEKKDYNTAITFWEKIVKIEPDNLRCLYNYGACNYRLGNLEKARELWLKVSAKDKNYQGVREHLKTVEEMLSKNNGKKGAPEPAVPEKNERKTFFNF